MFGRIGALPMITHILAVHQEQLDDLYRKLAVLQAQLDTHTHIPRGCTHSLPKCDRCKS